MHGGEDGRLELLGPLRMLDADGREVALGGPLARGVLALLATADDPFVSDATLVDELWGDDPPRSVIAALRVHVSQLRAALGAVGVGVERVRNGYRLGTTLTTDLDDVRRVAASPSATLDELEQGWRVWRGPSLADIRQFPFASRIGPVLDDQREQLMNRHAEALLRVGRGGDALSLLAAKVGEHVVDEHRWALVALAQHQVGQSVVALRTLARAREVLAETAGLEPGPLLRNAERAILADEPTNTSASPSEGVTPSVPRSLAGLQRRPCVGRRGLLDELRGVIERSFAEACSAVVTISGEPGVGKSRILAELAHGLTADGVHVEFVGASGETIASTAGAPNPGPTGRADSADWSIDWAEAVASRRELLLSLADRGRAVWLLDDVQWLDDPLVAAVRQLARHPIGLPVTIVGAERANSNRLGPRGVQRLGVPRLDEPSVAAWCEQEGAGDLATSIWDATHGLPWLVAEAVAHVTDARSDGARLRRFVLDALARDRWASLDPPVRTTVEWAAVLGEHFDLRALEELVPVPPLVALEHIDRLVEHGIIAYDVDVPNRMRFDHALLQEAIRSSIGERRAHRMHHRAFACSPALMAAAERFEHAVRAGELVPAAQLLSSAVEATDHLVSTRQFSEAQRVAARAVELSTTASSLDMDDVRRVAALHLSCARAAHAIRDLDAARRHAHELDALRASYDDDEVAVASLRADSLFGDRFVGQPDRVAVATRILERHADGPMAVYARQRLTFDHLQRGEIAPARRMLDALAADVADPSESIELVRLEHRIASASGDTPARLRAAARARSIREGHADARDRHHAGYVLAAEALHRGDTAYVSELADDLVREADRAGLAHAGWLARAIRFTPAFVDGRHADATDAAQAALSFGVDHGITEARGAFATQQFAVDWANRSLDGYVNHLRALADPDLPIVWRSGLALSLAHSDATAQQEARELLDELAPALAAGWGSWLGFVGIAVAVEAAALVGHVTLCEQAIPLLAHRTGSHIVLGHGAMDYGPVDRYHALALATVGDVDTARTVMASVASAASSGHEWRQRAATWIAAHGAEPAVTNRSTS